MKQIYCYLLLPFILVIALHPIAFAQTADIIFVNGKIFTSDTNKLYVQAIAIKGNRIIATGTNDEILKLADNKAKKIDVKGKTIVPGFNDAHDHPGFYAPIGKFFNQNADLNTRGLTKSAAIDSIALMLKEAKPGEWIHGLIGTDISPMSLTQTVLEVSSHATEPPRAHTAVRLLVPRLSSKVYRLNVSSESPSIFEMRSAESTAIPSINGA